MGTQAVVKIEDTIRRLDEAIKEYAIADTFKEAGSLSATLKLAEGMAVMRELLSADVVTKLLMPLRGSTLGFLTDRDSGKNSKGEPVEKYGWETVRDVTIEAFMRGFQPVGNEFNIISWRFYAAKNGIDRKVREFEGLTDLEHRPGTPVFHTSGDHALVPYIINYNLKGHPRSLALDVLRDAKDPKVQLADHRIYVRVNRGMGPDAVIGKAHRKATYLLLCNLTGSVLTLPSAEMGEDDIIPTTGTTVPDPQQEQPKSAQQSALDDLVARHKPANGAPTPEEARADEQAHSGKLGGTTHANRRTSD